MVAKKWQSGQMDSFGHKKRINGHTLVTLLGECFPVQKPIMIERGDRKAPVGPPFYVTATKKAG